MIKANFPVGERAPSEFFIDSLQGGGGTDVECQCGRRHLAYQTTSWDHDDEDGKFEDYCLAEHEKDPEGTILEPGYDSIYYVILNTQTYVVDCPCYWITKYEDFIWQHRNQIRNYLKKKIEQELKFWQQEHTLNKVLAVPTPEPFNPYQN